MVVVVVRAIVVAVVMVIMFMIWKGEKFTFN